MTEKNRHTYKNKEEEEMRGTQKKKKKITNQINQSKNEEKEAERGKDEPCLLVIQTRARIATVVMSAPKKSERVMPAFLLPFFWFVRTLFQIVSYHVS